MRTWTCARPTRDSLSATRASCRTRSRYPQLKTIVQVGIRDFCAEENDVLVSEKGRVMVVRSADIRRQQFSGVNWREQCDAIIEPLPDVVHVSFDIDGLDPTLCPHTGTPVPGGLAFEEATYLLSRLARSGRRIIGLRPGGGRSRLRRRLGRERWCPDALAPVWRPVGYKVTMMPFPCGRKSTLPAT